MRYRDLLEAPQDDIARAEQAQRATRIVTHAIYHGAKPDYHVEFTDHGEFLLYGADSLGLAAEFPAFDGLCLAFGLKDPNAIGYSGRVGRFSTGKLFDRYDRCIFFNCLTEIRTADVRSATNSTAFLSISNHEFMHLLDAERTDGRIMKGVSNAKDKVGYYNDPAEFNAYFHDVADALTYIGSAPQRGERAADYADLYSLTGDFVRDVSKMLNKDVYTSAFVKWLRDDRRKALLKRLYRLHQHVVGIIRDEKKAVTESNGDLRYVYHSTDAALSSLRKSGLHSSEWEDDEIAEIIGPGVHHLLFFTDRPQSEYGGTVLRFPANALTAEDAYSPDRGSFYHSTQPFAVAPSMLQMLDGEHWRPLLREKPLSTSKEFRRGRAS